MKRSVRILALAAAMIMVLSMASCALADKAKGGTAADLSTYTEEQLRQMTMFITGDYVNMRAGYAGTAGHKEIINWSNGLMKDEKVYCVDKHNGWYCLVCVRGDHVLCGWVWGDYVETLEKHTQRGGAVVAERGGTQQKYVGGVPTGNMDQVREKYSTQVDRVLRTLNRQ